MDLIIIGYNPTKRFLFVHFLVLLLVTLLNFAAVVFSIPVESVVLAASLQETNTSFTPVPLTSEKNELGNSTSHNVQVEIKTPNETVVMVETNSSISATNSSNSNYIIEYASVVFDNPDDIKTQQEWGGNCSIAHWDSCKVLNSWFGNYEDPKDGEIKEYRIDCKLEPVVCLKNSWTVTRCNLLCMSRCNREIMFKYDKYVSHSGECQAHAHG